MFKYFIMLFIQPRKTIRAILDAKFTHKRIILFLFWIGLIRGLHDIIRPYIVAGALPQLLLAIKVPSWYIIESGPFLLACIITAHIRWVIFALVTFILVRFFKNSGRFDDYLKLYGVIMGSYLISPIFNSIYFIRAFPAVEFFSSARYSQIIGLGQVVGAGLLLFITYKVLRQVAKLGVFESFLIGLFLPLLDRGLYIAFYKLYFSIDFISLFQLKEIFFIASILFIIGGLVSIPLLIWVGRLLSQKEGI